MSVFRARSDRTRIKPDALFMRKAIRPHGTSGGFTAIASSRTRRLVAALPLAGALLLGAAHAQTAPTPAPRPGDARAVDGGVREPLSQVPRPQQSPDRAPAPPPRPEDSAQDQPQAEPEGNAPPTTDRTVDAAPAAPEPAAASPEAAPSAPAAEAAAPETGPIGPPAPERAGPDNAPQPRPAYEPGPKPPLDDQSVATRETFGPPKANPLMADRVCQFAPAVHATFTLKPEIQTAEGCAVVNPVRLESVGNDPKISFVDPPVLSCAFANALADFLVGDVQKLAEKHLENPIVEVGPGTSYACRGRNNDDDAKLSEHAFGNAFDLQALRLADGTFLTVVGGWTTRGREKDFWRAFQNDACRHFRTVLGPNANKLHYDHFHLDMARRRNGYRLCQ